MVTVYLALILVIVPNTLSAIKNVEHVVSLISENLKKIEEYQWPTNFNQYFSSQQFQDYGTFDFVIVGGGTSGTVIANRLSANPNWRILLLEAGNKSNEFTEIPYMMGPLQFTEFNWAYNSTPQKTACQGMTNKICLYPRGKGLGGSTLINGLMYTQGFKTDYERWAKIAKDDRWGYKSVHKYFKKIEQFNYNNKVAPFEPNSRGTNGTLPVEYHTEENPQLDAFLEANKELGFKFIDPNTNKIGVGLEQMVIKNGKRIDNAKAYLEPIQSRSNLVILTGTLGTKVRIKNGVAIGVEFSTIKSENFFAKCTKEVVLAGGVFGTAQILMLSGIGPKQHLDEIGIPLIQNLPVGTTLMDHPAFMGLFISTNYTEPVKSLKQYVESYLENVGPLTVPHNSQSIGFYESRYNRGTGVPDLELLFIPSNCTDKLDKRIFGLTDQTYEDVFAKVNPTNSIFIIVVALNTKSVGTFSLKSKSPYEYPIIDSNLISDSENHDIDILYDGIELVLKLLKTKAFEKIGAKLNNSPLRACKEHIYLSKEYWYCALRQLTYDLYHPLGTAPMGSVVDSKLKIFGIENLRIADGSVIPLTLSAHPLAATIMIGEQLSDLINEEYSYTKDEL